MNEKFRKRIPLIAGFLCAALIALAAVNIKIAKQPGTAVTSEASETEWAVYWYLCGSNLESGSQSATLDLNEMLSVKLPANVKVIIEAGGSRSWGTKGIDPEKITRLSYGENGLKVIETLPQANMGGASTLSDFLTFCREKYPAKHSMVILWDHGGGSLYGVSYDQNYNMDCLTYTELKEAFAAAGDRKFDIIGFDACLMSSIDTVSSCKDAARYMIASEQLEPVCGWDYASLMNALSAEDVNAEELGKAICDGYYAGCKKEGLEESATLCLCDLSKTEPLLKAYNEKLLRRFDSVLISDEEAASLRRCAEDAENYGANGRSVGFTDMVDLKGYMGYDSLSEDYAFTGLIEDAVIYQVRGSAFKRGCGISCYYPLDASLRSVLQFTQAAAPGDDVSLFYRYMINPDLSDTVSGYAERRNISENDILKNRFRSATLSLTESPLEKTGGNELSLKLPEGVASNISDVKLKITGVFEVENTLFYDGDVMYFWMEEGVYPAKKADYNKGEFIFDAAGKRITMDGVSFATYVISDTEECTVLYSPAVIDDRDGVLFFSVSKPDGTVSFLGAYTGKAHTTGQYTMESILSDDENDLSDAERYDREAYMEKAPFDYSFTFDELFEYHEEFGCIGEPYEMEEYFHGKSEEENSAEEAEPDIAAFAFERLSPLKEGQLVTPIYSCIYTDRPEASSKETANFANWETTESVKYGSSTRFTFEPGHYSADYERSNLYSYTLSDAWGNEAESDPLLIPFG